MLLFNATLSLPVYFIFPLFQAVSSIDRGIVYGAGDCEFEFSINALVKIEFT